MALHLGVSELDDLRPRITVLGVGGAGGNAVNNMIRKELSGVDFVVANTDAQALRQINASNRIQLGVKLTEGLGAGASAETGAKAAEESIDQIADHLDGVHMCFITAGLGGGTGTGAAPVIARRARELGVLTVGVVTKPFQFEGAHRMRAAEEGVRSLQEMVDTLIVIPNQNLYRLTNETTTVINAFAMADDVLYQGVKGVTDLMVRPGLISLDFADVRTVMSETGKAMMGTGEASGENRAEKAAEAAISNPLLDEISLQGARGVLINITGDEKMTLFEFDEAATHIRKQVDGEANIIVGTTLDPELEGCVRVSVVATGISCAASTDVDSNGTTRPPRNHSADEQHILAINPAVASGSSHDGGQAKVASMAAPDPEAPNPAVNVAQFFDANTTAAGLAPAEAGVTFVNDEPGESLGQNNASSVDEDVLPRAPGEPSAETMERLRAAATRASSVPWPPSDAALIPDRVSPQKLDPVTDRPPRMLGVNSFIQRLAGAGNGAAVPDDQLVADDATVSSSARKHRMDTHIPAFLRRQAN